MSNIGTDIPKIALTGIAMTSLSFRFGVDFGGTKIEACALDANGGFAARVRRPNPGAYEACLEVVADLIAEVESLAGAGAKAVGVGAPGSISPATGLIRNANAQWLNGRPFDRDLARRLGRPVRVENDANCFALSEALPGDPDKAVFGVIIGTGCGGGVVVRGQVLSGRNGIAGEWGHTPLPWPNADEAGANACWCGRMNCLETWISGPAFEADFARRSGRRLSGEAIVGAVGSDPEAAAALERYASRLGRGLAMVCNILDPDIIVLGGGVSNAAVLYDHPALTRALREFAFADRIETPIRPPVHGDSSGVRGAAWLVEPSAGV